MAERIEAQDVLVQSKAGEYYVFPDTLEPITRDTPRSVEAKFDGVKFHFPKVRISGKDCRFVYSVWTEQERAEYRKYKASLGGGTARAPKVDVEKLDQLQSIIEANLSGPDKDKALSLVQALRPVEPEKKDRKFEALKAKVSALSQEQLEELRQVLSA